MRRMKAICSSAVDNSASNSITAVSDVRRSQRTRKKRTFGDEWIVEDPRHVESDVCCRNGTKKSKKEVSSSVNMMHSSAKSDLSKISPVRKSRRLSLKKQTGSVIIAKKLQDVYKSELSKHHNFQSIAPNDNNITSKTKMKTSCEINIVSNSENDDVFGSSAVIDNITEVETNKALNSSGSREVKQKSSKLASNEFCSSSQKLDLLAQVCSEIWKKMYEYHKPN